MRILRECLKALAKNTKNLNEFKKLCKKRFTNVNRFDIINIRIVDRGTNIIRNGPEKRIMQRSEDIH